MEQIKSFEQISSLVSSHMRKGVKTNNFLTAAEYKAYIALGKLFYLSRPEGLFIFRQRDMFKQLYFHLHELSCPPEMTAEETIVLELPTRPGDRGSYDIIEYWQRVGFINCLDRVRMQRTGNSLLPVNNIDVQIRIALPSNLAELWELYVVSFDPFTGCIPDKNELLHLIDSGKIFCALTPAGALCGFIEFTNGPTSQIRHLAVCKDMQGKNIAKELIRYYLSKISPKKSLVWTGKDNRAAIGAYSSNGYLQDGWQSSVLIKKQQT